MEMLDTSVKAIIPKVKEKMLEVKDDMIGFQEKTNEKIAKYIRWAFVFSGFIAIAILTGVGVYWNKQNTFERNVEESKKNTAIIVEYIKASRDTTGKR